MAALEKHYSVAEIATLWNLSEDSIRNIFRDEPGVLKIGSSFKRKKRGYVVLRVPESILQKVHESLRKAVPRAFTQAGEPAAQRTECTSVCESSDEKLAQEQAAMRQRWSVPRNNRRNSV
jgi:hypothetical protein